MASVGSLKKLIEDKLGMDSLNMTAGLHEGPIVHGMQTDGLQCSPLLLRQHAVINNDITC
jgi:hypothetical protein